jgi:hypothetical protein
MARAQDAAAAESVAWEIAMNIDFGPSTFNLPRDGLISLRDGKGTRVVCLTGALWVTQEGQVEDVILEPGQCLKIAEGGLALVMALRPSSLQVRAPRASSWSVPGRFVTWLARLSRTFAPA